jgi:hypothetical protein
VSLEKPSHKGKIRNGKSKGTNKGYFKGGRKGVFQGKTNQISLITFISLI